MKDGKTYLKALTNILVKYRYVLIAAAAGLALLLWPSSRTPEPEPSPAEPEQTAAADPGETERRIAALLSRAEGVGRVEVMLSLESDTEYVYADEYVRRREERDTGDGETAFSGEENLQILTVRGQDGGETPVIRRRISPAYRGAVVICDGAEDPGTRLNVIRAVGALTGLSSERITVIKMK